MKHAYVRLVSSTMSNHICLHSIQSCLKVSLHNITHLKSINGFTADLNDQALVNL
ncbi:hypothetical protein X975_26708, partial [Stegodyphus mimosarum]